LYSLFNYTFTPLNHQWSTLINAYGINGQGKSALGIFKEMQTAKVMPSNITYVCLLNACSHAGLVEDGIAIFTQLQQGINHYM